jgi:predicted O-methyltransferase YrrM
MAPQDPRILALHRASADYADAWCDEGPARAAARAKAHDIGLPVVSPGAGATLRMLTKAIAAKSVVEIGTGAGVSLLWLVEGMGDDGVVTSVDIEAEHQVIAREAVAAAGINTSRVRLINGRTDEVLGRLTEGGYDLVFIADKVRSLDTHISTARSLLRPGGLLVIDRALWNDRIADPSQRDDGTVAMRTAHAAIADDESFVSSLLPIGGGLLVAVYAPQ